MTNHGFKFRPSSLYHTLNQITGNQLIANILDLFLVVGNIRYKYLFKAV
jgi:hypothetical protein